MNMNGWKNWFLGNTKGIVIGLVVLIIALGSYGVMKDRERARERKASSLLYSIRKNTEKDINTRSFDAVLAKFQPIFDQFPNSRAAYEAQMMIGDMWMDAGDSEKAAAAYLRGHNMTSDTFSKLLAKYNEALAMEQGKLYEKADAAYNMALNIKGSDFLRPEILMAKARCLEALKRYDEARKLYIELRDKFSDRGFYSNAAAAFLGDLPK